MKNRLFYVLLLCNVYSLSAQAISLKTTDEKELAIELSQAANSLDAQVMRCIEDNQGKMNGCTCETRARCPFESEFNQFVNRYCAAVKIHPQWKHENLFWRFEADIAGYTLSTRSIENRFGHYCD